MKRIQYHTYGGPEVWLSRYTLAGARHLITSWQYPIMHIAIKALDSRKCAVTVHIPNLHNCRC